MLFASVVFGVFIAVCHHLLLWIRIMLLPVRFYCFDWCLSLVVCVVACLLFFTCVVCCAFIDVVLYI